jgi:drug/metabolite transporter (DMT)-like permease
VPVSAARYTLLALAFSLLWASGFAAIKIAFRYAPPLLLMASRFLVAGAGLLLIARLAGARVPRGRAAWRRIALLGLLNNACYLGITAVLLVHVSAGMGAVLASTNPLLLALVAPWALDEPLTRGRAAGLALSYAGVAWVMWSRIGRDNHPLAMAAWLVCIGFLVTGTILFKRWQLPHDLLVINGGQALAAGVALVPPALAFESLDQVRLAPGLLLAQAWLVVVISMGAMLLWFWLLQHGDATRASAWWFLNPVLGLVLAALVLGEPLGARDLAGAAVVAAGIWMVQRS